MTDHFVEVPKKVLSPAAQAVRRDIAQIMHELHQRCRVSVSVTDTLPITLETNEASLQAGINSLSAAAIRELVSRTKKRKVLTTLGVPMAYSKEYCLVEDLLAIATELEGQ